MSRMMMEEKTTIEKRGLSRYTWSAIGLGAAGGIVSGYGDFQTANVLGLTQVIHTFNESGGSMAVAAQLAESGARKVECYKISVTKGVPEQFQHHTITIENFNEESFLGCIEDLRSEVMVSAEWWKNEPVIDIAGPALFAAAAGIFIYGRWRKNAHKATPSLLSQEPPSF